MIKSVLVLSAILGAAAPAAGASQCDPALAPSSNYPFKYVDRGDRCEGVYIRLVGSSTLTLLSFTAAFDDFDPKTARTLDIRWIAPPGAAEVQLRALTTRPRLYYRMDTRVRADGMEYAWPTDVLAAMGLGRSDIGLVGWVRQTADGADQELLLPLAAAPVKPPRFPVGGAYTLRVQAAAQLGELFVTVTRAAAPGRPERAVQPTHELGYGYYPADEAIEIPIEAPAERGIHAVELGAKLRSGGVSTLRVLFYAPGAG